MRTGERDAIDERVDQLLRYMKCCEYIESRSREKCRECGAHVEARDYDPNVDKGYTERDIVWCRQCMHWVGLTKEAVTKR